jgi:hypothetical protein
MDLSLGACGACRTRPTRCAWDTSALESLTLDGRRQPVDFLLPDDVLGFVAHDLCLPMSPYDIAEDLANGSRDGEPRPDLAPYNTSSCSAACVVQVSATGMHSRPQQCVLKTC